MTGMLYWSLKKGFSVIILCNHECVQNRVGIRGGIRKTDSKCLKLVIANVLLSPLFFFILYSITIAVAGKKSDDYIIIGK